MKLYYGLPNEIWDNLYFEAEDLLQEESLGQYIVGVYPAGNRIYGIESYPPGLMCLYVDSVGSLIDPTSCYHKELGFKVYHVMNSRSPLYMVDFFKWIKWLTTDQTNDWRIEEFLHIIPFGEHILYEDDSISSILHSVRRLLICQNFKLYGDGLIRNPNRKLSYLFTRAYQNLIRTGRFKPCINKQWDEVLDPCLALDIKNHSEFDEEFISKTLKNEPVPVIEDNILTLHCSPKCRDPHIISDIRSQAVKLYRYQL